MCKDESDKYFFLWNSWQVFFQKVHPYMFFAQTLKLSEISKQNGVEAIFDNQFMRQIHAKRLKKIFGSVWDSPAK